MVPPRFPKIKFVVIDFQCIVVNRADLLLVSGAISHTMNKYNPIPLEGVAPLLLTAGDKLKMVRKPCDIWKMIAKSAGNPGNEPELSRWLLERAAQLPARPPVGYRRDKVKAWTVFLNKYLRASNDQVVPIVVLWNGTNTGKVVIDRLRLPTVEKIINMYTVGGGGGVYRVVLADITGSAGGKIIYSAYIGRIPGDKRQSPGLAETHQLIDCGVDHGILLDRGPADPMTNVIWTKCIFNFVIKNVPPSKLMTIFTGPKPN